MENQKILKIQSLNQDIVSSNMFDDFKGQFARYDGVQLLNEEHTASAEEKGIISFGASFLLNVAINVVSGLIIGFLKSVYAKHKKTDGYEWEVAVELGDGLETTVYKVTIYEENGMIMVRKSGTENKPRE